MHWTIPPERFRLLAGADAYATYEFGTQRREAPLLQAAAASRPSACARSDPDQIDVNARCLEGVDLDALAISRFDGTNWEAAYAQREEPRGARTSRTRSRAPRRPWLLFPLVVTAMLAYALATPHLDFAGALGQPEAANAALRPLSAIVLFYTLIALLERAFPYRPEWNRSQGDVCTDVFHLLFTGQGAQGLFFALASGR